MAGCPNVRTRLLAHLEACRPDTIFYAGTVGIGGALLTRPDAGFGTLLLAWLVPTLVWIAALYGGDYFDRDLDALTKPHRPVPSGRIAARTARTAMIALIVAGGLLAVLANPLTVVLAAVATVFGIGYARWLKGHGLWGNLVRGLPTALTLLYGSMLVQPLPAVQLLGLAVAFWVHDAASNLLGALCDRDGDRRGGYLTYPVQRGDDATVRALGGLYAGWVLLAVTWPALAPDRIDPLAYYLPLAVAMALAGASQLMVAAAARPIARAIGLRAHEVIVVERIVLGCAPIAAATRADIALWLGAPSLAATVLARRLMRTRYEPADHRPAG